MFKKRKQIFLINSVELKKYLLRINYARQKFKFKESLKIIFYFYVASIIKRQFIEIYSTVNDALYLLYFLVYSSLIQSMYSRMKRIIIIFLLF